MGNGFSGPVAIIDMKSMRAFIRIIGFLILTGGALGCSLAEGPGDPDSSVTVNVVDAATDIKRVLNSGPGETASRLPDCDQFRELNDKEPVEGENCIVWGLRTWGDLVGQMATVISIVDIDDSIVDYYDGHTEDFACEGWTGFGRERATVDYSFVPVEFRVIDIWKNLHGEVAGGLVRGSCSIGDSPLCRIRGGRWNLQPGLNLVLMGQLCCGQKYREGYFDIQAVYPVENGYVYDWDGDAIPVDEVRNILSSFPQEYAHEVGNLDIPCTEPDTYDVIEPPVGDIMEVFE